ncbi:MAG TPA: prepilin-type N-terminal cleavage/methylation domain-containing protein [Terriglobales bacterium]|jgi:prepilin-type N-terminal cleavage/methylation domain-containing protein|nr:prepilin-type N-terminal cleavage/methylation domain-containing protein [Terriglobales bacterium]
MQRDKGFSLIELLIVVAIILIIAAVAIPNLIRARIAANESSAVSSVRTIMTAEAAYATAYPDVGFAPALSNLTGSPPCAASSTTACLIDTVLAGGTKAGYSFTATGGTPTPLGVNTTFIVGAAPYAPNVSGVRRFCGQNDNVIHFDFNPGLSSALPTAADCGNPPFAGQVVQ